MFGKSDNGFLMITQCIAPEYPQAFDSESTFNNLTEFLKHENDTVCKLLTVFIYQEIFTGCRQDVDTWESLQTQIICLPSWRDVDPIAWVIIAIAIG